MGNKRWTNINSARDGGVHSVVTDFVGNGYGDMSSRPGQDCLHFT